MTAVIDKKFGNIAPQLQYLKQPLRFLNSRTVAFQGGLRSQSSSAKPGEGWNSLPFKGGLFEKPAPKLQPEIYAPDMVAFSPWRSQHKDVGEAFGSHAKSRGLLDIRWSSSLRPSDGPSRTEHCKTTWLGRKQWYHSDGAIEDCNGDLDARIKDVKLEYINNVKHIIPHHK